jgi:ribosome-binding protein aMBF1 (putative translation factor)
MIKKMVEKCARCGVNQNEIKVYDAIYEGMMSCLCERCSIIENIPIIKKPNTAQLKESEESIKVHNRMKTISGIRDSNQPPETFFKEDRLTELEQNPERELPEEKQLNLIEHFHWMVMKNRRRKGLSQEQLATALGESEIAIQMIENNKLPENAETLIRKLEQFFQIKIRKLTEMEKYLEHKNQKQNQEPILLDEHGIELDTIPEPEQVIIEPEEEQEETNALESYEQSRELERIKRIQEEKERAKNKEDEEDIFKEEYYPIVRKKQVQEQTLEINNNANTINNRDKNLSANDILTKELDEVSSESTQQPSQQHQQPHQTQHQQPHQTQPHQTQTQTQPQPLQQPKDFNLKKSDLSKVTINQLKDIHRRKVEVTRQERVEEQRKIEERQRILEAMRERDRMKQERERQQKIIEQQRTEQDKRSLIEERKQELQRIKKRESDEIDQYLGGSELLNKNNNQNNQNNNQNQQSNHQNLEDRDSIQEFDDELI